MLVNRPSAFNAVVPKQVLGVNTAQNFKTKPMEYDSVSFGIFGMAKAPKKAIKAPEEVTKAPDFSQETLQAMYDKRHFEAFASIMDYYARTSRTSELADILGAKIDVSINPNCPTDTRKVSLLYGMTRLEDSKPFLHAMKAFKGTDKEKLFNLLSEEHIIRDDNDHSSPEEPNTEENAIQRAVIGKKDNAFFKAIIDAFDKKNPKDNKMLAKTIIALNAFGLSEVTDPSVKKLYAETVEYLALYCKDISNEESVDLINHAVSRGFIPQDLSEQLVKAKAGA